MDFRSNICFDDQFIESTFKGKLISSVISAYCGAVKESNNNTLDKILENTEIIRTSLISQVNETSARAFEVEKLLEVAKNELKHAKTQIKSLETNNEFHKQNEKNAKEIVELRSELNKQKMKSARVDALTVKNNELMAKNEDLQVELINCRRFLDMVWV
jgi:DNA repair exonuclease SbcCD ATPase subunit